MSGILSQPRSALRADLLAGAAAVRTPAGRVVVVGGALAVALAIFGRLGIGGLARFWEGAEWAVLGATAVLAAALAVRDATALARVEANRAELLERVLAASDAVGRGGATPDAFARMLEVLVPDEAAGAVLTISDDSGIEIVASAGDTTRSRATPTGPAPLPLSLLRDGRAAGYRASNRPLPPSVTREPRSAAAPSGAMARLAVPIVRQDGTLYGALLFEDFAAERVVDATFVELALIVRNQIVAAIENDRLVGELQARLDEMRRVQDGLVSASRQAAIGDLAGAVAHEVNNPLTGVLGYAELLLAELPADDPRRADVDVIHSQALRAREIVRSLMEFARPKVAERRPVDVGELVRKTLDLLRYHVSRNGVHIEESYADLPTVELDAGAIEQALIHVLTNAVQAMASGGTLRVATMARGDEVAIRVEDDGVGIPAEIVGRLFQPFLTTRSTAGGTGLGLAMSHGLVTAHGGRIEISSAPGVGTTVEIILPSAPPSNSWPESLSASDAGAGSRERIEAGASPSRVPAPTPG
ncbi:MAG: sensor histidine kinase [Chloroflexota bacterium]